jgi:diguanylate cyclase
VSERTPSPGLSGARGQRSRPGLDWYVVTLPGLAVVLCAFWVTANQVTGLPAAFWVIAAQAVVFELRPILATRQQPEGILLSTAFIFAIVFGWGLWPAVVVMTVGNALSELIAKRPVRDAVFTVATLALGFGSAAGTMALLGVRPSIGAPIHAIFAVDLLWMLLAWSAHFLVVHLLVNEGATLIHGPSAYPVVRAGFVDEFWFYVISDLVVVGLSPLVVVLAQTASPPLLLLIASPFAAVWKGAAMSRSQQDVALHDMLTGLPDRRLFLERSVELLGRAEAPATAGPIYEGFALLLIDLDGFKQVNDSFGHHVGDLLLREVGHRMRHVAGEIDQVARLGGDEFALLLPGVISVKAAVEVGNRVRDLLRAAFHVEGESIFVDGSVGIALAPEHGHEIGELLRHADVAMYVAKRNLLGVVVYSEADGGEIRDHGRGRAGRRATDRPANHPAGRDIEPG